jgi:hypothetical protein
MGAGVFAGRRLELGEQLGDGVSAVKSLDEQIDHLLI